MTDTRRYKNNLLIPFSLSIFLILLPEVTSDRNIIVIDYLLEPFGVHNNDFLSGLIYYFLLFYIFKWSSFNSSIYTLRNNYGFHLHIFFGSYIYRDESKPVPNLIYAILNCASQQIVVT